MLFVAGNELLVVVLRVVEEVDGASVDENGGNGYWVNETRLREVELKVMELQGKLEGWGCEWSRSGGY